MEQQNLENNVKQIEGNDTACSQQIRETERSNERTELDNILFEKTNTQGSFIEVSTNGTWKHRTQRSISLDIQDWINKKREKRKNSTGSLENYPNLTQTTEVFSSPEKEIDENQIKKRKRSNDIECSTAKKYTESKSMVWETLDMVLKEIKQLQRNIERNTQKKIKESATNLNFLAKKIDGKEFRTQIKALPETANKNDAPARKACATYTQTETTILTFSKNDSQLKKTCEVATQTKGRYENHNKVLEEDLKIATHYDDIQKIINKKWHGAMYKNTKILEGDPLKENLDNILIMETDEMHKKENQHIAERYPELYGDPLYKSKNGSINIIEQCTRTKQKEGQVMTSTKTMYRIETTCDEEGNERMEDIYNILLTLRDFIESEVREINVLVRNKIDKTFLRKIVECI